MLSSMGWFSTRNMCCSFMGEPISAWYVPWKCGRTNNHPIYLEKHSSAKVNRQLVEFVAFSAMIKSNMESPSDPLLSAMRKCIWSNRRSVLTSSQRPYCILVIFILIILNYAFRLSETRFLKVILVLKMHLNIGLNMLPSTPLCHVYILV